MALRSRAGEVPVLASLALALVALQQESGGSRGAAARAAPAAAGAADKDGRMGKWRLVGVEDLLLSMQRAPAVPASAAPTGVAPGKLSQTKSCD